MTGKLPCPPPLWNTFLSSMCQQLLVSMPEPRHTPKPSLQGLATSQAKLHSGPFAAAWQHSKTGQTVILCKHQQKEGERRGLLQLQEEPVHPCWIPGMGMTAEQCIREQCPLPDQWWEDWQALLILVQGCC